jgi:hypothetical protein
MHSKKVMRIESAELLAPTEDGFRDGWLMPQAAQEAAMKQSASSKALRNPLLPPPLHPIELAAL